jgi:hypothetical protein
MNWLERLLIWMLQIEVLREVADINERLYIIGKEWYEREVLDGKGDSDSKDQIPTGESKE